MALLTAPRLLIAVLAVLLVSLAPMDAHTHDFEPERQVFVQVFSDHVDVMVVYTEAPGMRADFFNAHFGFRINADADERLRDLAGRMLLPRVLDGLQFEVKSEQPKTGEPQIKFDDAEEHLRAAAYVRYQLEELDENQRRTLVIRAEDRPFLSTEVLVYGGEEVVPIGGDVPRADTESPVHFFRLHRADAHEVTFQRRDDDQYQ